MEKHDFLYLLHGTINDSPELLEDIFNNGLKSWYQTSLYSTMTPISNEDIENVGLETLMKNYVKGEFKSVFLIKIPKEYMSQRLHRNGQIDPPVPVWKSNDDGTTTFTPHLVQGVYNKTTDLFITNPNFSLVFDPSGLKYSEEQINNLWSLNQLEWINFAKERENLTFNQLFQSDRNKETWNNIIHEYCEKFGVKPKEVICDVSEYKYELESKLSAQSHNKN